MCECLPWWKTLYINHIIFKSCWADINWNCTFLRVNFFLVYILLMQFWPVSSWGIQNFRTLHDFVKVLEFASFWNEICSGVMSTWHVVPDIYWMMFLADDHFVLDKRFIFDGCRFHPTKGCCAVTEEDFFLTLFIYLCVFQGSFCRMDKFRD